MRKRVSYRNKLFFTFIALSIVPLIVLAYSTNFYIRSRLVEEKSEVERSYLAERFQSYDSWLKEQKKVVDNLAVTAIELNKHYLHQEESFDVICAALDKMNQIYPEILNIYYTLEDGNYFNSAYNRTDIDLTQRTWYQDAKRNGVSTWSDPYEDQITGELVVTLSTPLYNEEGDFIGACGLDILYEDVYGYFQPIYLDLHMSLAIFDRVGTFIDVVGNFDAEDEEVKRLLKNIVYTQSEEREFRKDKTVYIYSIHSMEMSGWRIVAIKSKAEYYDGYEVLNEFILLAGIVTVIISFFIAINLSGHLNKPLEDLQKAAFQITGGSYGFQLKNHYRDDFDDVIDSFNNMSISLESYEKDTQYKNAQLELRNQELLDINTELKASYEQLNAATQQLNDSEKRYRLLINNIYDVVLLLDGSNHVNYVSEQVFELMGIRPNKMVGYSLLDVNEVYRFLDMEELNALLERAKKQNVLSENLLVKHLEGKISQVEISTRLVSDLEKVTYLQIVIRDITKRKEMEERIVRKNNALTTVNRISVNMAQVLDLEKLLSMVANDLVELMKLPMVAIRLVKEDQLMLAAYKGIYENYIPKTGIGIDEDVIGRAYKEKKPFLVDRESDLSHSPYAEKYLQKLGDVSLFFMPIQTGEKVFGVMTVTLDKELDTYDESIVQAVSHQMALRMENIELLEDMKNSYFSTIHALIAAEEAKDKYTQGHSHRVSQIALCIAEEMRLEEVEKKAVEIGGILHDIGKIGIFDSILNKNDTLDSYEYEQIKQHPTIGQKIVASCEFGNMIEDIILFHHKRFDLKGYPEHVELEKLPLGAAIVGVADALDAMTSSRPYRQALSLEEAMKEIIRNRGTQFDPFIVDLLSRIWEERPGEIKEILYKESTLLL